MVVNVNVKATAQCHSEGLRSTDYVMETDGPQQDKTHGVIRQEGQAPSWTWGSLSLRESRHPLLPPRHGQGFLGGGGGGAGVQWYVG